MNHKSIHLVCLTILTLLAATFSTNLVSAYPETIREKTFITYYGDPIVGDGTENYNVFAYSDIHWKTGTQQILYYINTQGAPIEAAAAVKAGFEAWDVEVNSLNLFTDNPSTIIKVTGGKFDGKNVVSWGRLGKGIIAQTTVWYNTQTKEIVEFGMVFSTAYKWGIDPDGEAGVTLTKAFDVQDIATHEAGHTLMLDDLYMPEANKLTMYGYGSYGDTFARSLGVGDKMGISYIYGP